jgi:hypothetical protein
MWRLAVLVLIGCGRLGFDPTGTAGDASLSADAAVDADLVAVCALTPFGHWRMDETAGSVIADSAGGNDGAWTDSNNGDVFDEAMPGRRGGALEFDNNRYVFVVGFVIPAEGTFAAWLTSTFDDTIDLVEHPLLLDAPTPRTTISFADGDYDLRTRGIDSQATYNPSTDLTTWFHLAATWSATGAQLYLDGVPVGMPGTAEARSNSLADLYIGTREGFDRSWFGLIDDVRIYDRAMTSAEVAALYACP